MGCKPVVVCFVPEFFAKVVFFDVVAAKLKIDIASKHNTIANKLRAATNPDLRLRFLFMAVED